MKTLIVVPAYNEQQVIGRTISAIKTATSTLGSRTILVIDDGSSDLTAQKAKQSGALVARHIINRGLGGALGTGLEYARISKFDIMVTFDADGQHDPSDIAKIIAPLTDGSADVVIGSRTKSSHGHMPWDRKLLIAMSNVLTELLFNQITSDSQSGFRAFNKQAITHIHIKTQRMEVSSEFFSEIRRLNLKMREVPIKVIYTDYSRSKGQSNTNALNILYKLVLRLFR